MSFIHTDSRTSYLLGVAIPDRLKLIVHMPAKFNMTELYCYKKGKVGLSKIFDHKSSANAAIRAIQ